MKNNLVAALFLLIISCSKEPKISTDFQHLPMRIQDKITDAENQCPTCGIVITMFKYNKKIIFGEICGGYSASKNLICDCIMRYYNQDGELIPYSAERYKDINKKVKLVKEVYRCAE